MTHLTMPSAKKAAIHLRFFLKEQGVTIPLSMAQEAIARSRGAASFQVLQAYEAEVSRAAQPKTPVAVTFTVAVQATDEELLDDALEEYALGSTAMPLLNKVAALSVEQTREYSFLKNGSALVTVTPEEESDRFQVHVSAEVLDTKVLREYAATRRSLAWGHAEDLANAPLADCLYEVLCASNHRDAPVNLGFEYLGKKKSA